LEDPATYLAMNCITFVCRFLIFHYALFGNRSRSPTAELSSRGPAADGSEPRQDAALLTVADDAPAQPKVPG
jgi:hypothetical protein